MKDDFKQYDLPLPEDAPVNDDILQQLARGTISGDFLLLSGKNQASQLENFVLPDVEGTIVSTSATQTLTNKTINGGNNTIENVSYSAITGLPDVDSTFLLPANGRLAGTTGKVFNTNTTASVSRVFLPGRITVNKLTINAGAITTPGTVKVGIYSEDGQTKEIDVTTGTISAAGVVTVSGIAVTLATGHYYVVMVPVGTFDGELTYWTGTLLSAFSVGSEPVYEGQLTVSAGTLPSTFDPTAVSSFSGEAIVVRLDN